MSEIPKIINKFTIYEAVYTPYPVVNRFIIIEKVRTLDGPRDRITNQSFATLREAKGFIKDLEVNNHVE